MWSTFAKDGSLSNTSTPWLSSGEPLAGAIAVKFTLQPGEKKIIPMAISWDLPVTEFGSGRQWHRRYTDFYGTSGKNAWSIARDGLLNAKKWSEAIDNWQAPYVNDESKPLWYRGMLFNEMYVLADSGTLWGKPVGAGDKMPTTYSFMECFDYPYFETLDVRFYGSMPLVKFWPDIDKQVMRDFADTVPKDLNDRMVWVWKTQHSGQQTFRERKTKGAVPHDMGVPTEDPFFQVNQFSWQDTNGWKDLNSKFVLMIYRDYVLTGSKDKEFLRYTWPAIQEALVYLGKFDRDGDGIPDNDGYPDQTYDEWVVRGDSAYSGSLWLASLRAAEEIAKELGDAKAAAHYTRTVCQGTKKLYRQAVEWNLLPLRHGKRIPGQYSGGPACRPVVRGHDRTGRHRAARNAGQSPEKHFRQQRNEIRQRRNGRGERRCRGRHRDQNERAGAGSVDGDDAGAGGIYARRGHEKRSISDRLGNLSREL